MEVVTFDMELDMSADDYDEEAMIAELAAYYGVDPSLISLEAEPITERRRLASAGLGLEADEAWVDTVVGG